MNSLVLRVLRLYKRWISPAFPPSCRYVPTCSEYAMETVERYGALRGGAMAAWRVLRCHPLAKGGLDPVVKAAGNGTAHVATAALGRRAEPGSAAQSAPYAPFAHERK
ncbi:MAG: membrane protein insertion efficiency factor YidD [Terriglobales bacterium]